MEYLLFWLLLAILVGAYASGKGRSGFGYFLLGVLLSPIIAFLILLIAGENRQKAEGRKIGLGHVRKCPSCAELIKPEAVVCRFCGRDVPKLEDERDRSDVTPVEREAGPTLDDEPKPPTEILGEENAKPSNELNWWLIVAGGIGISALLAWLNY